MAIEFKDGKYVDPQTGRVTLDPTVYKDWQIAEEAEKNLPPVDYFREKLGLLPEEIIPYGKTPKIDFIKVMKRLKDKPDGKFIEVTAITPTPFGEGKSTVSLGLIEGLGKLGLNVGGALRQPSGGPTMNVKGTAAGGGNALLMPMTGAWMTCSPSVPSMTIRVKTRPVSTPDGQPTELYGIMWNFNVSARDFPKSSSTENGSAPSSRMLTGRCSHGSCSRLPVSRRAMTRHWVSPM